MPKSYVLLFVVLLLSVPFHASLADETATAEQEILHEIELPRTPFYPCLGYSPDGETIATGLGNAVVFWDAATGKQLRSLKTSDETTRINALDFSPDGRYLAAGGNDDSAIIWDLSVNKIISSYNIYETAYHREACDKPETEYTTTEKAEAYSVKFSPDGNKLAVASFDTVVVLDTLSGDEIMKMDYSSEDDNRKSRVSSVSFNVNGSMLAVGMKEAVDIWDPKSGKLMRTLDCKGLGCRHSATVTTVGFRPVDNKIFSYGFDHTTAMWDVETGHADWTIVNSNPVTPLIEEGSVRGPCNPCHTGHDQSDWKPLVVDSCGLTAAFSPDGKLLATGSKNRALIIRDAVTGKRVKTFTPYEDNAWRLKSVAYSPDGGHIAVLVDVLLRPAKVVGQNAYQINTIKLIVYDASYDGGPEAALRNNILNLTDERDTKINLAYINKPEQEASEEAARITKEYDALIEKEKAAFEAEQKAAEPAVEQVPVPEK